MTENLSINKYFRVRFSYISILFLFLVNNQINAQTITGTVSETLKKPLESANVIALPTDKNAQLKFAIADNKGHYKLLLDSSL